MNETPASIVGMVVALYNFREIFAAEKGEALALEQAAEEALLRYAEDNALAIPDLIDLIEESIPSELGRVRSKVEQAIISVADRLSYAELNANDLEAVQPITAPKEEGLGIASAAWAKKPETLKKAPQEFDPEDARFEYMPQGGGPLPSKSNTPIPFFS